MNLLQRTGLVLGLGVLISPWAVANQCLVQEEPRGNALSGGASGDGAAKQRTWVARYPLRPAGSVSVENVQGDVRVEAWDRAEVEVAVLKRALGPAANPDDVRIEVESNGSKLVVRATYPAPSEEPVRVDFRLRVPRQVQLERLRTVVGDIRVRGTEGPVDARTLNGNIEGMNITGGVVARAINGSIAVSLRSLAEGAAPVEMETVNGHLYLGLPAEANADLQVSAVAGRIDGKYTFKVSEVPGDTSLRTTLGHGGAKVRLRTVRGDIHVAESDELL
jgi:hypothetical protein